MRTFRTQARLAGALYTAVLVTAPLGLVYVPNKLIVSGDAAATAANVRETPDLLRAGVGSELFHQALEVWLVIALFRLFAPIDRNLARQLAILGLLPIPIAFINTLTELAALALQSGTSYLTAFSAGQLDALTALCLRLHGLGLQVAGVFWGLWLLPFGMLIIRCKFIPAVLGYLTWAAGIGYVLNSVLVLVLPGFLHPAGDIADFMTLGELPIILWLLVIGARGERALETCCE
jgi:hypothetical protein